MNLIFVSGKILPRPPPSVSPPSGTPFDCLRSIINAAHREHVKVDSLRLIQQGKRDCSGLFSLSHTHTLSLFLSPCHIFVAGRRNEEDGRRRKR